MEELLLSLNGPWSNAACIGYCAMAMRNAGLSEKTQCKVLDELTRCFDDVSVEDAAQMKFEQTKNPPTLARRSMQGDFI